MNNSYQIKIEMKKKTKRVSAVVYGAAVALLFGCSIVVCKSLAASGRSLLYQNIEALVQNEEYRCSAKAYCIHYSTVYGEVSCSGNNKCVSGYNYVECDGNRSDCVWPFTL